MSLYATLADARSELGAEDTIDDGKLMRSLRQISRRIDDMFKIQNLFVPTIVLNRNIPLSPTQINSTDGTLAFGIPLLSLSGVGLNNQTLTIGTNVQSYPPSITPSYQLQLLGDCWASWYRSYCSDARGVQFATISGIWGYNANYAEAWLEVTTLSDGIDDTETVFEVVSFDGPDAYGDEPAISAGHVIQIDTEWMDVVKTVAITDEDTLITTYTLTVRRGVNGSTKAAHVIDSPVSVYLVEESIRRAVARQAAFQYSRIGAFNTSQTNDIGIVRFAPDLLQEVYGLLKAFANL